MAESHSEDSPLLGADDHPSPGERSPEPRAGAPTWEQNFSEDDKLWSPADYYVGLDEMLHVPARRGSPKPVQSQTSMDSGCECDPSDSVEGSSHEAFPQNSSSNGGTLRISRGASPLSPSQASTSEPSSPGPSGCMAPLAQKESLDCHCGAIDQQCICDTNIESNNVPNDLSSGGREGQGPEPTHTDRGQLNNPASKVTFRIEGYDDDPEDIIEARTNIGNGANCQFTEYSSQTGSELPVEDVKEFVRGAARPFIKVASYSMRTGMLSASSSTASMPICRICHLPQGEGLDILISPCRCAGTMQFIHESCLMKWLEISSKRSKKAPACELCNYQFNRHKKFRFKHWQLPSCSRADKILHSIFLLCLLVMAASATVTVYSFKQDRFNRKREDIDLTKSEIVTLTCGVLFFIAFFLAMYVEVKAKDTLYKLFTRFLYLNQTWHIDDYDRRRDSQFGHDPV